MHKDFDAARRAYGVSRSEISFTLGGETFITLPDPSLGDTFDLYDAPPIELETFNPNGKNEIILVKILSGFIRRMLKEEDRPRFDRALYRIPASQSIVIMECATYITENLTPLEVDVDNPSQPPITSSDGRDITGSHSKNASAGTNPSS